jgi:hypothetical protein
MATSLIIHFLPQRTQRKDFLTFLNNLFEQLEYIKLEYDCFFILCILSGQNNWSKQLVKKIISVFSVVKIKNEFLEMS